MKDKKLHEILRSKREELNFTQSQMASALGIGLRMYQRIESEETIPTGGVREKYLNKLSTLKISNSDKPIPYYDVDVSAGQVEMFDQAEAPAFFAAIPGFEDCNFGIRVFGHSMYPTYPNGIYVVCKSIKDYDIIPYGECFLVITDELRMVKRLMKSKYKGFVLATSDNEELKSGNRVYDNFELPKAKIRSLHLVKGQVRKEQI